MTLHVTNGDSAAGTLRETTLGGEVLAWRDVLHEGPVPAGPRRELLRARAAYLTACGWDTDPATLEARDAQLLGADAVVLWFEHDLYDQLQLIDVLALLDDPPELIVVDSYLGELTADELETLWPSRRVASEQAHETAAEVWAAFRQPEPTALAEWATREIPELPFLAAALRRLLEELPAAAGGLSRTERAALEAVAAGAATPAEAFVASQRLEEARFLGDAWFYRTLLSLDGLLDGELRLTRDGERVLAGEADRVELLGIDRWLGGTHVTPENDWRWDGVRLVAPGTPR